MPTDAPEIANLIGQVLQEVRDLRREVMAVHADLVELRNRQGSAPALTIHEASKMLNCGRAQVFRLISEKRLDLAPKFGRKRTVTTASVLALIEPPEPEKKQKRSSRAKSGEDLGAAVRALDW